jgi:hypothetical protein
VGQGLLVLALLEQRASLLHTPAALVEVLPHR